MSLPVFKFYNLFNRATTFRTFLVIVCVFFHFGEASGQQSFEIRKGEFFLNGKAIHIRSGEMHYARIPQLYWRHRLQMAKAMGLNTISTYVFWNYHNTAPGVWDFKTGNRNIREFLSLAKEEGLNVILRPGPYACAEWEFGGYPWWLQKNKELVLRSNNQPFLDSCRVYIRKLYEQVADYQVQQGGPVIMVQVENEFGSYVMQREDVDKAEHRKYLLAIYDMLVQTGFKGPFFTSDGTWLFDGGSIPGVLPTANGEGNIENLRKAVDSFGFKGGPYMVAEFYPGWLDHWGEPFVRISPAETATLTERYLSNNVHFSYYMVHGGTNFGFTAGANYNDEHHIQPDITSYDYDAPISEAGWVTPKYNAIRDVIGKYAKLPDVPARLPVLPAQEITLSRTVDFFEWKKTIKPVTSDVPLSFEDLNQGTGYVLYSRSFTQPIRGRLVINGLRDFAVVYINGKRVGELNRQMNKYEFDVDIPFNARLELLVENMGRINYGAEIVNNKKGIISEVQIDGNTISGGWKMYPLPFSRVPDIPNLSDRSVPGNPSISYGTFELVSPGDTFLDMSGWGKGIVFVNGNHLGRYWKIGPQQTLYVPGCWLKKGTNEIVIFEQLNDVPRRTVPMTTEPVLDN